VTCAPGDDVDAALALMREPGVQHLPVVEGSEVVGLVWLADIVFGRPDEQRGRPRSAL
jgi:CBS domain-containing protein